MTSPANVRYPGLVSWFIICAILTACAANKANVDYLPVTDFTAYKSFAWQPAESQGEQNQRARNAMVDARIQTAVDQHLTAKGMAKFPFESADLHVNYHVSMSSQEQRSRGSVSIGSSHSSGRSSVGFSVRMPVGGTRTLQEGTLVLDLIDAKTKQLVWQSSAKRTIKDGMAPEQITQLVNEVVSELLSQYPPSTAQ